MPQAADVVHVTTNPGPQSQAFASTADITGFGGSAGGGKSHITLLRFGVHADRYPGYEGMIFRREMPMVTQAGGLWEESVKMYPMFGARPNYSDHNWRWKRANAFGSLLQFRSLQHEKDMLNVQGGQLAEFGLDEATQFLESQFWYLFSRLRTTNAPTFKPRCFLTFNPDPDSWVRKLIDWYIGEDGYPIPERAGVKRWFLRDGNDMIWGATPAEVRALAPPSIANDPDNKPKSLRFIPAKLADNPRGDPTYASRLNALPLVERMQLLGGNWNIRASAGNVFKREWFEIVDHLPSDIARVGRYWDLAATEPNPSNNDPDWTRGVKMSRHHSGLFFIQDVASRRGRPYEVETLVQACAEQDTRRVAVGFWKDPGSAGKSEADRYVRMLAGWDVVVKPASSDKLTNAKAASSQAENGKIKLLRGPWNEAFLAEHEAFPDGKHDDIVDAESLGMQDLTGAYAAPKPVHIRGL